MTNDNYKLQITNDKLQITNDKLLMTNKYIRPNGFILKMNPVTTPAFFSTNYIFGKESLAKKHAGLFLKDKN